MAKLRIRIKLNEGGEGAPLSQLVAVAEQAERFFRYLALDAGMTIPRASWLARNFGNESVSFDAEHPGHAVEEVKEFNGRFNFVASFDPKQQAVNGYVRHRTLVQYTNIPDGLDSHERMQFGLYHADGETPFHWQQLSKRSAISLREQLLREHSYVGTVQGVIHDINVDGLSFNLRPARGGELVKCDFGERMYRDVIKAVETRGARLYVQGRIVARRVDKAVRSMTVQNIRPAPRLDRERYESFFGADPEYGGAMTSEEITEFATTYDD